MYLERKLKRKKIKRILIVVIPILILLIGSSFAFFTFYKANEAFILIMKGVPMQVEFKEGTNVIEVPFAYPISDEYAKANLDKLGYVDFKVRGGTPGSEYLYYELYLTEEDGNTLDSNYIKVYLTDENNQKVVEPSIYNKLPFSTSNNRNGKILYNESLTGIFEKNYRLYVWIDKDYTQNKVNQTFSFKVNLYAYNGLGTASSVIKSKLVKYEESSKEDFTGGLVAVNTDGDLYNETDSNQTIREYRYSGPTVNNYVTFNNETWRIVGVFIDEYGEETVKIVKSDYIDNSIIPVTYIKNLKTYILKENDKSNGANYYSYDTTNTNVPSSDWTTAGLQYYLNTEQDDSEVPNYGYLHYIDEDSKKMIKQSTYYLGNVSNLYNSERNEPDIMVKTKEAFVEERGNILCDSSVKSNSHEKNCNVWSTNKSSWTGEIALLYPSDYGYSANSSFWTNTNLCKYNQGVNVAQSWMLNNNSKAFWLLSPTSNSTNSVTDYDWLGVNDVIVPNKLFYVLPTLYLKSNVKITGGDGSSPEKAYQLSYQDENNSELAIDEIKSKLVKYENSSKEEFQGGLVGVNTDGNLYNETDSSQTIREYRYSGSDVNNYVIFNNETWRIIGIFKGTEEEPNEEYIKIVRNEMLTSNMLPNYYEINGQKYKIKSSDGAFNVYWNRFEPSEGTEKNNWPTAGIQYYLNTEKDNATSEINRGYMSYLSGESKKMLVSVTHYLGAVNENIVAPTDTAKTAYSRERDVEGCIDGVGPSSNNDGEIVRSSEGCQVWAGNSAKWNGKVSLMYLSDYGYAASNQYWNTGITSIDETPNWIYKTINYLPNWFQVWFLSPSSKLNSRISFFRNDGKVYGGIGQEVDTAILPVLNLSNKVKIENSQIADGSKEKPYILLIE